MTDESHELQPSDKWHVRDASGQIEGPFDLEEMIAGVAQCKFKENSEVTRSGDDHWRPITDWKEFQGVKSGAATKTLPNYDPEDLVCIYACLVNPVVWLIGIIQVWATGSTIENMSPLYGAEIGAIWVNVIGSTIAAAIILLGGVRLTKKLDNSFEIIAVGIGLSFLLGVLGLVQIVGLQSTAEEFDFVTKTTGGAIGDVLLLLVISLPDFVFQIAVLGYLLIFKVNIRQLFQFHVPEAKPAETKS